MILAPEPLAPPPDTEAAESYLHRPPMQMVARAEPKWLKRQQYAFRRSVLPIEGGRVLLRLTGIPMVEVNPATKECDVLGWGIRMSCDSVHNLPNEMARRFLDLFSKADTGRLNETEQQCWMEILDQVDFQAFCIDRAAPHYVEGKLVRLTPVCIVEWHDGERQQINDEVARSLSCLRPDDEFGAYVKLGKENTVRSIERIVILATAGE